MRVLGLDVVASEDGAGWLAFLWTLVALAVRRTPGDQRRPHPGVVDAIGATLPGGRAGDADRGSLCAESGDGGAEVGTGVRAQTCIHHTISEQPDAAEAHAQFDRVEASEAKFPNVAILLAGPLGERPIDTGIYAGIGLQKLGEPVHWMSIQLDGGTKHSADRFIAFPS